MQFLRLMTQILVSATRVALYKVKMCASDFSQARLGTFQRELTSSKTSAQEEYRLFLRRFARRREKPPGSGGDAAAKFPR
jgi:hypothetical protein